MNLEISVDIKYVDIINMLILSTDIIKTNMHFLKYIINYH